MFVCSSAGTECVVCVRSGYLQPDKDNCNGLCVGRNNQLQRNGVKSQQSKQELAEKVWGLERTAGSMGTSSVMQILLKKE